MTLAASHLSEYLGRADGAPPSVGRIDEKDMSDVPRFLNRCGCVCRCAATLHGCRARQACWAAAAAGGSWSWLQRGGVPSIAVAPAPHPCRLLGLEPAAQQALFDFYQATLDALMERARRTGALGA